MVAKISVGNSLYGALAYNGEKINEAKGRLLTANRIYNDGSGTVDIHRAMEDFLSFMPAQSRVEKPVVHISLNFLYIVIIPITIKIGIKIFFTIQLYMEIFFCEKSKFIIAIQQT